MNWYTTLWSKILESSNGPPTLLYICLYEEYHYIKYSNNNISMYYKLKQGQLSGNSYLTLWKIVKK